VCYWPLTYRGQVRYFTSYDTGRHPTTKNHLTQNVISATAEKPQIKVSLSTEQSFYEAQIKDNENNLVAVIPN